MSLQAGLDRCLIATTHTLKDSFEDLFEVLVKNFCALEYLEDDLEEDCAFRVVDCHVGFDAEHGLVCDLDQHLETSFFLHDSVTAIDHVVVQRIHQGIAEGAFVFYEYFFHAREYLEYDIRYDTCLLDEVLQNDQDVILEANLGWVNHILENGDVSLFVLGRVLLHQCLVLSHLL